MNVVQPAAVFGSVRLWITVSVPKSADGKRSIVRSPNEPGMPAAPPFVHWAPVAKSTPAQPRMLTDGWPYEPGMSISPPCGLFQVPIESRLTVPPFRSVITSAPPRNASGTWNSLRCELPPKSGSWSSRRILELGPKRSR